MSSPRDTDGRLLRLHCGPSDHPAVASHLVVIGPCEVRLDVLAASHRVSVRRPAGSGADSTWDIDETVACADGLGLALPDALPGDHRRRSGRWNVHFRSRLDVGLGAVADAVGELESLVGRSDSLVVRFPGADQALTGLRATSRAGAGGLTWHSWHCYPGANPHVVRTTTVVTPAAGDPVDPTDRRPHPTERDRRP